MPQTNPVDDELVSSVQGQCNGLRTGGRRKVAQGEDGAGAPTRGGRVHHVPLSGSKACHWAGAAIGAVGAVAAESTICELGAGSTIVARAVGGVPVARIAAAACCCRENRVVGNVDRIAGKEMIEEHDPNLSGDCGPTCGLIVDDSALARLELRLHRRRHRWQRRRRWTRRRTRWTRRR